MPLHLAQMNSVKQEDPTTSEALKSGDFFVAKSQVPFIALFTDQALKRYGGIVGLSQDDSDLDRLVTIGPQLTRMVKQYFSGFPRFSQTSERSEHHQLSGDFAVSTETNALKLLPLQCTVPHSLWGSLEQWSEYFCVGRTMTGRVVR